MLQYLLHQPVSTQPLPLILFLHGSGERGDDLELVKKHGLPKLLVTRTDFPFVVVSPQCPAETWWTDHADALSALMEKISTTLEYDHTRVYLTGLSMGGEGAWYLAAHQPQRFAAVAPICGAVPQKRDFKEIICQLKTLPIWVFHGEQDPVVPIQHSRDLVSMVEDCEGKVQLTVYPELGHNSWTVTYDNPALYDWFLNHRIGGD